MSNNVLIIAEAGVNHNGDINTALRLIDTAAESGANVVKFQSFVAENIVTRSAPQADYQMKNLGAADGQYAMLKKLELSGEAHEILIKHSQARGIRFMSTAFDEASVDLLKRLGCTTWKIPSGEITNLPHLRRIGAFGQEIILSTGMATLGEVESAIDAVVDAGTARKQIILLHCTTEYPAPIDEVNLRAMVNMGTMFGVRYGYSDHTRGIEIPIAAAALGACVIEKHFTLDRTMQGPDHAASLEPNELNEMVRSIRNVERSIGDGVKRVAPSEARNRMVVRKSIVAKRAIHKGECFSLENITVKRSHAGISPMQWDEVIGRVANKDFLQDEAVLL